MKKLFVFGIVGALVLAVAIPAMAAAGTAIRNRAGTCLTGTPISLSGVVEKERVTGTMPEIKTSDGTLYELGLGPIGYKDINLKIGDNVELSGVVSQFNGENHLAVLSISVNGGEKVVLRELGSRPQWAGSGVGCGNGNVGNCQNSIKNQ